MRAGRVSKPEGAGTSGDPFEAYFALERRVLDAESSDDGIDELRDMLHEERAGGRGGVGGFQSRDAGHDAGEGAAVGVEAGARNETLLDAELEARLVEINELEPTPLAAAKSVFDLAHQMEVERRAVAEKYRDRTMPPALSPSELVARIEPFLEIVPRILAGGEASYFHSAAVEIQRASSHVQISPEEFAGLTRRTGGRTVTRFSAGYLGGKGQLAIANTVMERFGNEVKAVQQRAVVRFWLVELYVSYVLANEVAARVVAEDFGCGLEEAYAVMEETGDYGRWGEPAEPPQKHAHTHTPDSNSSRTHRSARTPDPHPTHSADSPSSTSSGSPPDLLQLL